MRKAFLVLGIPVLAVALSHKSDCDNEFTG